MLNFEILKSEILKSLNLECGMMNVEILKSLNLECGMKNVEILKFEI